MDFRSPKAATETNANALAYLTKNLTDSDAGIAMFNDLQAELGNAAYTYPCWHPILTVPPQDTSDCVFSLENLKYYQGIDHTFIFIRGFITCPYSEDSADSLVNTANQLHELHAYRLDKPLYSDNAYPVVVISNDVLLEADGTIRSRDALAWCSQFLVKNARVSQIAETWWNMLEYNILGGPHGARSSLFVNQYTGGHMRKILETFNNSGMFGPIRERSLAMLSENNRKRISETLIRTAIDCWDKKNNTFEFNLRGENCEAAVNDTWNDGFELFIRIRIGTHDLYVEGFYYAENDRITSKDPEGKRTIAEKFL